MKTKSFLARSLNHRAKVRATVSEASVFEPEPEPKSQNFELQSQSQNKYFNLCQKSKPFKEHLFSLITSETRQRGVIQFLEALPCNKATKPSKSHRLNPVPELIPSYIRVFLLSFDYPSRKRMFNLFSREVPKARRKAAVIFISLPWLLQQRLCTNFSWRRNFKMRIKWGCWILVIRISNELRFSYFPVILLVYIVANRSVLRVLHWKS